MSGRRYNRRCDLPLGGLIFKGSLETSRVINWKRARSNHPARRLPLANGKTGMSKNFELMNELLLKEALRKTSPDSKSTEVVVLGSAADRRDVRAPLDFDAVAQQECFKLVQRLFLAQASNVFHAVVFAGIDRGDGCSRICVEVARILAANTSASICLLDANFRSPSLPGFLGVPNNNRGFADSLVAEGSIRNFAKQLEPSNLWLLSAGTVDAVSSSLLNSDRLKLRLEELRKEFNYVLIDSPALNHYTDALALGGIADGLVVVLQADSTRRESALKGLQTLREAHIQVLGAVLNQRTFPIPGFVYRRL
jgi:Mrp family chromosome partitioning ATPase